MTTPASTIGRASVRRNNFDVIRLVAASQVVLFHGLEHLGPPGVTHSVFGEALSWFPGVPIFFVVSGFLISLSYERSPSVAEYFRNRALRIFPALWACLLVSLAVIMLFAMPLEVSPSAAGLLGWWAAQMSVAQFYNPEFLRGFGVGVLNGSLWTIPVELQFYLALPLLYAVLRRFSASHSAWLVTALSLVMLNVGVTQWASSQGTSLPVKLMFVTVLPYLYLFLLGTVLQRQFTTVAPWLEGRGLQWLAVYLVACAGAKALGWSVGNNDSNPLLAILLGITTISLAFTARDWSERLLAGNDISYGTYIYHMLVVNALLAAGYDGQLRWVALAVLLTYVLALASWRIVEMPFLRRKHATLRTVRASTSVTGKVG
jgi:peptidoglycan/LPS O-acetylase OafA/YrhL